MDQSESRSDLGSTCCYDQKLRQPRNLCVPATSKNSKWPREPLWRPTRETIEIISERCIEADGTIDEREAITRFPQDKAQEITDQESAQEIKRNRGSSRLDVANGFERIGEQH